MEEYITIGFKNGEADFGVSAKFMDLNYEQIKQLREIIPVAVWCAEDMWRKGTWYEESHKGQKASQPTNNPN